MSSALEHLVAGSQGAITKRIDLALLVYALRRPDPAPEVFGYHEVLHALVIAAAVAHYAVVAFYVLPHS